MEDASSLARSRGAWEAAAELLERADRFTLPTGSTARTGAWSARPNTGLAPANAVEPARW